MVVMRVCTICLVVVCFFTADADVNTSNNSNTIEISDSEPNTEINHNSGSTSNLTNSKDKVSESSSESENHISDSSVSKQNSNTEPTADARKKNRRRKPLIMKFFLAVDGEIIGNILTHKGRSADEEDKVLADDLSVKLSELLDESTLERIIQRKDENGFVSLKNITEEGVKAKLKMNKLQISLTIPSDSKKERYRSIFKYKKPKKKSKLKPAKISAMLNGRLSHSDSDGIKSDMGIFSPNLNVLGLNIESKYTCQKQSNDRTRWQRSYLSAIYDFRETSDRLFLGDVTSYATDYQSIPKLWGFGFAHFANKDSRSVAKDIRIDIDRPSTIKIYVNDILLKTEQIFPGSYTYNDIPFQHGSNDIRIEITDDTGKVTEINNSYFRDGSILNPGECEYSVSIGKPEVNLNGEHYSSKYMGAGFIKVGIWDGLEGNVGYQQNSIGVMQSIGLSAANILGSFYGTYAESLQGEKEKIKGTAKKLRYGMNSLQMDDITINASLELEEKHQLFMPYLSNTDDLDQFAKKSITLLDFPESESPSSKSITTSLSFSIPSLGAFKFLSKKRLNKDKTYQLTRSIGISKNMRFSDSTYFKDASFVMDLSKTYGVEKQKSLRVGVVLRLKNSVSASSTLNRTFSEYGQNYSLGSTLSFSKIREVPFSGSFTKNYSSDAQGFSNSLHYDSENVKSDFNYRNVKSNYKTRVNKQIAAESGIFFADGEFGLSQKNPGTSGFVLVVPDKTLEKFPMSLNGAAETDTGAIVDTVTYDEIKTFDVNISDMPRGMKVQNKTFNAVGEYKRGYIVKLKTEGGSCAVKGYLKYPNGVPLKNVSGYMIRLSDGRKTPFFTNKKGKFSVIGMKDGKYEMTIFGETLTQPITFTLKKLQKFEYQKVGVLSVHTKESPPES